VLHKLALALVTDLQQGLHSHILQHAHIAAIVLMSPGDARHVGCAQHVGCHCVSQETSKVIEQYG
jgi:hypothetical protein